MATIPTEAIENDPGLDVGGDELDDVEIGSGNNFMDGFNKLDLVRQLGLLVGLAASVAIGFAVVLWSQSDDYQPIYPNMEGYDITEMLNILSSQGIEYKMGANGNIPLVLTDDVLSIRLELAAAGLTQDTGIGFELLDEEQGLGTSQFMENTRYLRAKEGELARTITSIHSIRSARVHLAIPKRSVFVRSSRKPTASVFLNLRSGKIITDEQVLAITSLVSSSIPELQVEDVTVIDHKGRLLSKKEQSSELEIAAKQYDYTRKYEDTLNERISRILQPIAGMNGYRAELTVEMDFTKTEQTAEIYNPDFPALRSEQTLNEAKSGNTLNGGIPGALSNQPPLNAQAPEVAAAVKDSNGAPSNNRRQSTRNYELDRTISHTQYQMVSIKRLSIAVVLDDHITGMGAEAVHTPWTEKELENVRVLVQDAVGYSAMRGDTINVINTAFRVPDVVVIEAIPIWEQPWAIKASKQIAGGLFILLIVFGVLKPVLSNLATINLEGKELALAAAEGEFADLDIDEDDISDDTVTLSGGDEVLLPGPNEGYEKQLNAIKGLIAEDPGRVAQIVKQWIMQDG